MTSRTTWNHCPISYNDEIRQAPASLWLERVRIWDEHWRYYFMLKAIIFVTISETLWVLPGWVNGMTTYFVCIDDASRVYLPSSQKRAYTRNHRFWDWKRKYPGMKRQFDVTAAHGEETRRWTSSDVFEMVQNIKITFEKLVKGVTKSKAHTPFKNLCILYIYLER